MDTVPIAWPGVARAVVAALARCGGRPRRAAVSIPTRTRRPLPADQPAAAQDTGTGAQRSDRGVARHDAAHRRAAAADLSFAGARGSTRHAGGATGYVLRLSAAARPCVPRDRSAPEGTAKPGRDHRSGSRTDIA